MIYYNKPNIKSAIIRFSLVICVLFAPAYHAFAKHKYNNHITGKTQNRTVQEAPFNHDSTEQQYDASFLSFRAPDKLVDKILEYAKKQKGKPYRRGSKGPYGFDCSGFTKHVYGHFDYNLNPNSAAQYLQGISIDKKELKRGDLVFFKGRNSKASRIGHVGMITEVYPNGKFKFIHSASSQGIREDMSTAPYYERRYVGARRIIIETPADIIMNAIVLTDEEDFDNAAPFVETQLGKERPEPEHQEILPTAINIKQVQKSTKSNGRKTVSRN